MLTYSARRRVFQLDSGATFSLPDDVSVTFLFEPLQPFGMDAGGGRTGVAGKAAQALYNANTGRITVESAEPLQPLDVRIVEEATREVTLKGNELTIRQRCESITELSGLTEAVFYVLPLLLALECVDPVTVARVHGVVGSVPFRWELERALLPFHLTSQASQENAFARARQRIELFTGIRNRRVLLRFIISISRSG